MKILEQTTFKYKNQWNVVNKSRFLMSLVVKRIFKVDVAGGINVNQEVLENSPSSWFTLIDLLKNGELSH